MLKMDSAGFDAPCVTGSRVVEPVVLRRHGTPEPFFRRVRRAVEHVFDTWSLSRLCAPMEVDVVSSLSGLVAARGLV